MISARDSILLSTSYKSPNAVHVFSFSTDDKNLFPCIPEPDAAVIRTQVDLQGWTIEALSPTTTLLTLLDQSDPKGWSSKSSIPQQMIAALAGVREFSIKRGGPPVVARFGGAIVTTMKYDHDKSLFKVEYEGSETRGHSLISVNDVLQVAAEESVIDLSAGSSARVKSSSKPAAAGQVPKIECEIRCDIETWATTLELVVDPPPQGVSCWKRHRLSSGGSGLWITIEHDALFVGEDRILVVIRKGASTNPKDKGAVMMNGILVKVDVEKLPEGEVESLADSDTTAGSGSVTPVRSGPPSLAKALAAAGLTASTTNGAAAVFAPASYASTPSSASSGPLHDEVQRGLAVLDSHPSYYEQNNLRMQGTERPTQVTEPAISTAKLLVCFWAP